MEMLGKGWLLEQDTASAIYPPPNYSLRAEAWLLHHYWIIWGGSGCQTASPCVILFHLPYLFQCSHLQTYPRITQVCLCAQHRNLCWIIVVRLVVNLRRNTIDFSHSTVIHSSILSINSNRGISKLILSALVSNFSNLV